MDLHYFAYEMTSINQWLLPISYHMTLNIANSEFDLQ